MIILCLLLYNESNFLLEFETVTVLFKHIFKSVLASSYLVKLYCIFSSGNVTCRM